MFNKNFLEDSIQTVSSDHSNPKGDHEFLTGLELEKKIELVILNKSKYLNFIRKLMVSYQGKIEKFTTSEDVFSELILKLIEQRRKWPANVQEEYFIYWCIRSELNNRASLKRPEFEELSETLSNDSHHEMIYELDSNQFVEMVVKKLEPSEALKKIFLMEVQGYKMKEISQSLNISYYKIKELRSDIVMVIKRLDKSFRWSDLSTWW